MESVKMFRDHTVFIDTSPFIYHIEGNPKYREWLSAFFDELDCGSFFAFASVLALMEVLVVPYKHDRQSTIQLLENLLLNTWNLKLLPVGNEIARLAARMRADHNPTLADAVHIASAVYHEADFFLTNDRKLKRVRQCRVICLDDLQPTK